MVFSVLILDGSFRKYLNKENPLSSSGTLAQSYSDLVKMIFREDNGVIVSPSEFKTKMCMVNSQFRGNDQQDAQEFLASLLDGLHEDLNQGIKVKGGKGYLIGPRSIPSFALIPDEKDHLLTEGVNLLFII